MRFPPRRAFAHLALATCALLIVPARAEHCTELRLLSGTGILVHTGYVGCVVPEGDVDTDFINPGSTTLLIRVFGEQRPANTSRITFAGFSSASGPGCIPGERCTLTTWTRGENATGEPPGPYWDSRQLFITRDSSINGGEAAITICFDPAGDHCETRTYRTVV